LLPLGAFTAAAHGSGIYANLAGSLSFGQIVKSGEPAFAAAVGYLVYGTKVSPAKLACLVPVIGGIVLSSSAELDYTLSSLLAMSFANVMSAFRGAENKRVMSGELKSDIGGVSNAYAMTTLIATFLLLPVVFLSGEAARFDEFIAIWQADGVPGSAGNLRWNALVSGIVFYLYNEVSTKSLTLLSGLSHSVANTAKRAVVIVGSAVFLGEEMNLTTSVGCCIALCGTFLYTIVDDLPGLKSKSR